MVSRCRAGYHIKENEKKKQSSCCFESFIATIGCHLLAYKGQCKSAPRISTLKCTEWNALAKCQHIVWWAFGILLELTQYYSSCCPCTDPYFNQHKKQKRAGIQIKRKKQFMHGCVYSAALANPRETGSQRHTQPCIYNLHTK